MVDAILSIIGMILYPLFSIIFVILAIVQLIFKAFAGTGSIGISGAGGGAGAVRDLVTGANDGGEFSTGIVYYLLTRPLVKNLIMSIMLLALFLIIIFTVMAFIKNAYASKQKTWQEIIGNAFKGLAGFIFIPVCCLLGVWAGNILLNAIDGATSLGGSVELEKKLFIACAYNANHIRNNTDKYKKIDDNGKTKAYNLCVELLDDAVGVTGDKLDIQLEERGTSNADMEYYATIVDTIYSQADYSKSYWINIYDWGSTGRGYALWNINYLVLLVVGIFMIGVMINLAYGMIKRLFWLTMLFVISPGLCALYPLDDGSAVGGYKKEFIKHTISAYSAVAGMNIFMSLLPFIEGISLTRAMTSSSSGLSLVGSVDLYVQVIVMVSGLFVVKEFISTLAGWIGGGNALADGESLKKSVTDKVNGKIKSGVGVFSKAVGARNAGGSFFGSLAKQSFDGVKKASGFSDLEKTWKESAAAGEKEVQQEIKESNIRKIAEKYRQGNVTGAMADAKAAGVEKDVLEVIAQDINRERIREGRRRGNTDVVQTITADKLEEHAKATKEEQDARRDLMTARNNANTTRTNASTALASYTIAELDAIGGSAFIEESMRDRRTIEIQESWGAAEKQRAMDLNRHIEAMREADSEFKTAANAYTEKAKVVADIKGGIRDQSEAGFQVSGHGPASKTEIKTNVDDIVDAATNTANSLNAINVNFDDAVQSLQRFSSGITASTNAAKQRVTQANRGQRIIDQTQNGKK